MRTALPLPARVYAQAAILRTLVAQIQEPSPDKVLALETQLTRLATDADVEKYLAALRSCAPTRKMLDERWLPAAYSLDDLERCAPGTLGEAYRRHMIENDLRPDFFAPIAPDDDFGFARLRMYQTHDLWHAVTGYPTSVLGEVAIVGFYLGHFERHMGDRAAAAIAFTAILSGTMLMHAALFRQDRITHFYRALFEGWTRGQAAEPFFAVRFEEMWDRPLADVRKELGVGPSRLARVEAASLAA
jgi:ubiquinone biosynthesis protein Coq4